MRAPFAMDDAREIEALVASAGFRNVATTQRVGTVRFASIERMVQCQVAGSPLAGHVAQVGETDRAALLAAMKTPLRRYAGADGLALPIAAHLVRADA
jgi:hypothetical protein